MPDAPPRRIGLLFVHGIGQQKRFQHLVDSVTEFAELMRQCDSESRVSVIDRTADWKLPPGRPDPAGTAPITLTFKSRERHIVFECHEVWWADLGTRSGILDQVTFWLWGLGQWCAPIYRELDASHLRKENEPGFPRPISSLARLPESVAGKPGETVARLTLFLAGLAALFVALTWMLAKRVLAFLLGQAPTPTLIVQYIGDARTYEERASPGNSSISDPGHPRRVGIRRRMITEMVALGSSSVLDGWYVVAHSLGTVVAYNGLTEIGHALPNYLPQEQWTSLDNEFKCDEFCHRREDVHAMMPSRPDWLTQEDVINRPLLFSKLRGFLTYGSPLDKFAAIWPRIVATAHDRLDEAAPLGKCRWINLAAPHDPVAGFIDSFRPGKGTMGERSIPNVENSATPLAWDYIYSHIRYFVGAERFNEGLSSIQKRDVVTWVLGDEAGPIASHPLGPVDRFLAIQVMYFIMVLMLWIGTAGLLTALGGLSTSLFRAQEPIQFATLYDFFRALLPVLGPTLGVALSTMLACGVWRWVRESRLNTRLAQFDCQHDRDESPERREYWRSIISMLRGHSVVAVCVSVAFVLVVPAAIVSDVAKPDVLGYAPAWLRAASGELSAASALVLILIAVFAQTGVNYAFRIIKGDNEAAGPSEGIETSNRG